MKFFGEKLEKSWKKWSGDFWPNDFKGFRHFWVTFLAFGFLIFGCWILRRGVPRNWGVEPMTETSSNCSGQAKRVPLV